jgi:putative DNA primase/helicase
MPAGAAVRLMAHGDTLGIAEGIETALSASALFGVPC